MWWFASIKVSSTSGLAAKTQNNSNKQNLEKNIEVVNSKIASTS